MINTINLKNFKCFNNIELSLSRLNVLTGLNGMGKSSVIQSILLVKQSNEHEELSKKIILNGKYVTLGKCKDILNEHADVEEIGIAFAEDNKKMSIVTNYEADSDLIEIKCLRGNLLPWMKAGFEYINAERVAPKSVYEQSSLYVDVYNQLGINGQYTTHYLAKHQDDMLDYIKIGQKVLFRDVIQQWLNEISPNIKINIHNVENSNLSQLNYYYVSDQKSNFYRPVNVGFGITYILPIITALIKAKPSTTLILENPEAHIHPKGQRKMGELIAETAQRGVQIFLETHSDHILNGIRIAVKNQIIKDDDVRLFYFGLKGNTRIVERPRILCNGRLDFWPDGFFDEWENALNEII